MCLLLIAYRVHQFPLVMAANRDEYYARPSLPAAFWPDSPEVLAGRDRLHGGTWLGTTRSGRIAAITNYRENGGRCADAPSRGALVRRLLVDPQPIAACLEQIHATAHLYPGFSLVAGDLESLWYYSNRDGQIRELTPGIYGLSNHLLDTAWPKVTVGKRGLSNILASESVPSVDSLLALLGDRNTVDDTRLPDTGVGVERERQLAPLFIDGESYGTRCSTVVIGSESGRIRFVERRHERAPIGHRDASFDFPMSVIRQRV